MTDSEIAEIMGKMVDWVQSCEDRIAGLEAAISDLRALIEKTPLPPSAPSFLPPSQTLPPSVSPPPTPHPSQTVTLQHGEISEGRSNHPKASEIVAEATGNGRDKSRGARLPDDWALPDGWREWGIGRVTKSVRGMRYVDAAAFVDEQAEVFANHWRSAVGQAGRKADWEATWRNWIIRAISMERKALYAKASPDAASTTGAAIDRLRAKGKDIQAYAAERFIKRFGDSDGDVFDVEPNNG